MVARMHGVVRPPAPFPWNPTTSDRPSAPIDPERPKADRVGGDEMIADAVDLTLNGQGPLPLNVQVAVDAGRHPGGLEPLDARAGSAVWIEGGIVPEDVKGLVARAKAGGVLQGAAEGGQLAVGGR